MKYAHKMKKDGREEACKAEKRKPEKLESKNKKDPEAYSSWEEKSQRGLLSAKKRKTRVRLENEQQNEGAAKKEAGCKNQGSRGRNTEHKMKTDERERAGKARKREEDNPEEKKSWATEKNTPGISSKKRLTLPSPQFPEVA